MTGYHDKAKLFVSGAIVSLLIAGNAYAASNGIIAYPCRDSGGWQNICFINEDGSGKVQKTFMKYGADALPNWDPTGRYLTYTQLDGRRNTMNIVTMKIGRRIRTTVLTGGVAPAWSPDGNWISYLHPGSNGTAQIWIMHPDGSNQHALTADGLSKGQMTWSPDSQYIAYIQFDSNMQNPSVWIMDASGANAHELTSDKSYTNSDESGNEINTAADANSPNWNPTNNQIAFWSGVEGQTGQVWVINSDGSDRKQLTHNVSSNNDDPAWSADGTKILFSTNYNEPQGKQAMWVMNGDGTNQHKITENTSNPFPGDAAWQPGR